MIYSVLDKISNDHIKQQFHKSKSFSCLIPFTCRDSEIFLSRTLRILLEEINQSHLHAHLEYVLNELSANVSKANSKRLYFIESGLDINDSEQYGKGMVKFKETVFNDFSLFERKLVESESFVEILLEIKEDHLQIQIRGNSPIIEQEKIRIGERIESARKFENLTDVLATGFDSTEGAGFGLIIVLLMLRKVNLDERVLKFENRDGNCLTTLQIPLNLITAEQSKLIALAIAGELKLMPQFPENIRKLQLELNNPDCSFQSIADTVNEDMVLAAEIIRIANSPAFRGGGKITDVISAIRMIGMLGVKSVLYNYGVNKVFRNRYDEKLLKELNRHSFMVALIGSFLARYKKIAKLADEIFVAGLLHDMGKIIISSINRDLEKKLHDLCRDKHIPIAVLDDLTDGFNHSLIGAEVAGTWNFPENFIDVIRNHHIPLESDEKYRVVTYAVYLANEVYYYEKGERDFNDFNHSVLSFFGLQTEESFQQFFEALKLEGFGL